MLDQGGAFIVRMLVEAETDLPHRFDTIMSGELERLREHAIGGRRVGQAR